MISRFHAVAKVGRLQLTGLLAWLLWLLIHLVYIVGFKSRLATAISWTWSFLGRTRGHLAVTGATGGREDSHQPARRLGRFPGGTRGGDGLGTVSTVASVPASALAVGIDVGGTSIRACVVDDTGEVLDSVQAPTPQSAKALEDALDRAVRELASRHRIAAVGLAVAGFISSDLTTVRFAPAPAVEERAGRERSE